MLRYQSHAQLLLKRHGIALAAFNIALQEKLWRGTKYLPLIIRHMHLNLQHTDHELL